jgi:hypothetical protein
MLIDDTSVHLASMPMPLRRKGGAVTHAPYQLRMAQLGCRFTEQSLGQREHIGARYGAPAPSSVDSEHSNT